MNSTGSQSLLAEMAWQEVETTFGEADFVVFPRKATEQHSTHLPTSVDSIRTKNLAAESVAAAPGRNLDLLVLSVLPYGYSEHHISYAGTISLRADMYQEIIIDVDRSVQHCGKTWSLVANFHGGNAEPHKLTLDRFQHDHGLDSCYAHWTDFAHDQLEARFGTEWGHADEYEMSVIEHCHFDLARGDRRVPQTKKNRYEVRQYAHSDDLAVEGGPSGSMQSGSEFLEEAIESTTDCILMYLRSGLEQRGPRWWGGRETDRRTKSSKIASRNEG